MNVLVYFLHHFYKCGWLENIVIHGVDSSELPSEILKPLIKLAQALGINIKLITADQAYHDSDWFQHPSIKQF